jgi:hypothetical protein
VCVAQTAAPSAAPTAAPSSPTGAGTGTMPGKGGKGKGRLDPLHAALLGVGCGVGGAVAAVVAFLVWRRWEEERSKKRNGRGTQAGLAGLVELMLEGHRGSEVDEGVSKALMSVLAERTPQAVIDFAELKLTAAFASGGSGQIFRGT